jgi:hypothetical protein
MPDDKRTSFTLVCLTTLEGAQTRSTYEWNRMVDRLMNNELERIWKEAIRPNLKYYPPIFLQ